MSNLWSKIFTKTVEAHPLNSPITLIAEQAKYLAESSGGTFTAELNSSEKISYGQLETVEYSFRITMPLKRYGFELFSVNHNFSSWYPLQVTFPLEQTVTKTHLGEVATDKVFIVNNEDELTEVLNNIFSHPKTLGVFEILSERLKHSSGFPL